MKTISTWERLKTKYNIGLQLLRFKTLTFLGLDRLLIKRMNTFYYDSFYFANFGQYWNNAYWLGVPTQKIPMDLWIYQEIIFQNKPDIIIECGTAQGGTSLFLATICDLIGHGRVISVDVVKNDKRPVHKRLRYLLGSSTSKKIFATVKKKLGKKSKVMVILDSDHSRKHVLKELQMYSKLVTPGQYLVVEDTNLNGHPVIPHFGPGPWEAVTEFLKNNTEFFVDTEKEKFFLTSNPRGYLRKEKKIEQKNS